MTNTLSFHGFFMSRDCLELKFICSKDFLIFGIVHWWRQIVKLNQGFGRITVSDALAPTKVCLP